MKWFRNRRALRVTVALLAVLAASGATLQPDPLGAAAAFSSTLGGWLRHAVAGSAVEAALYRAMELPGGRFLFPRPPSEARPELNALIEKHASEASLWQLRALEDEQTLDFKAAERDWKMFVKKAPNKSAAEMELADFYGRRLQPQNELTVLESVGRAPASAQERFTPSADQQQWKAWERAVRVTEHYALPKAVEERVYGGWEARYAHDKAVYQREFSWLLDGGNFAGAKQLIARYRGKFPHDEITPVQYEAELASTQGSAHDGLAIYDRSFKPLWPAKLVSAWYHLLLQGRDLHRETDRLRARIAANPSDLDDVARLFYIEQQQGQSAAAEAVLDNFRKRRDASGSKWSDDELYTLARLEESADDVPEAARYYYALAANHAGAKTRPDARLKGLAGLARLLLKNPQQPLRVGAANLALYRNIATMDRGPGYLNGILSLLLNASSPGSELAQEDQLAVPYYHRAKAAEIVALIDKEYPNAPERADLHAELIHAYQAYGDNEAVIREGTAFLAQFPDAKQRVQVALETADAYSRTGQTAKEFVIYQQLLKELAARAGGVPLGNAGPVWSQPVTPPRRNRGSFPAAAQQRYQSMAAPDANSPQYAEVLNRYLSELVSLHRLPEALQVLRGEVERNPRDPGLYERLAQFFEQNQLNSHVEEVYQRAIQQFHGESWYAKLARFYLRRRRDADYAALSRKVTDIFSGTEMDRYLEQASAPNWQLAFEVHLYAHQRFPHDLTFVRDLISDYRRKGQMQQVDELLWAHWSEAPDLRNEFFERLSQTRRLESVLAQLRQQAPQIGAGQWAALAKSNPAAERFWVAACVWQSHFQQAVDAAGALAAAYPANAKMGGEAASLYRSFAYFHPQDTDKAVAVENRLLSADPGNLNTMARIGDIYADRGRMANADVYWVRMGTARPGDANGYLQSATVFWDYFDFAHAMDELRMARERLHEPTLFGYQAGAIEESAGNMAAAVREYVASALGTASSEQSRERLLTLARKPALRTVIENATANLMQGVAPEPAAISLRVAILGAEKRHNEMAQELTALAGRTQSFDVLAAIATAARQNSLPDVEVTSLQKQIALTTDPVRKLQLRYQLADLLVKQKRTAQAAAQIDAIDSAHPKILGVVRATVNFDWNHGRRQQAVSVLLNAAQVAYPKLQQDFRLEAASKLTKLGNYTQAKTLLQGLLAAKPFDPRFETAMAANFARSADQAGLVAFDRRQLNALKASGLDPAQKMQRIGQLRRSIIAADTTLGNWSDAVDQYIALINSYPDDAGLAQQAALFAIAHNERTRLFAFYQKTIEHSPRDPRWSIVLARLATAADDFPAAIAAYGKAIALRPERQDLLMAQVDLDARLQRFDDAVVDFQKLYKLSYHDPQWMQKVAEVRARQGREADAVQALETAWIGTGAAKAANDFKVAKQLEEWNMLDAARKFAEQGVNRAGANLLVDATDRDGAQTYARIMTRLRQTGAAWARLQAARQAAGKVTMTAVAQQAFKNGFAGVTSEEWRRQQQQVRTQMAVVGFGRAMKAMGSTVAQYYTPQRKVQFEAWLRSKSVGASDFELREIYLPAAHAAKLAELEADLRWQLVERNPHLDSSDLHSWVALEGRRVQLEGAGKKIEALAASKTGSARLSLLHDAVQVYRRNGEPVAELRVLEELKRAGNLRGIALTRFYRLLLAQRPQKLIGMATTDSAAQYLVEHGSAAQALQAIDVRAANLPPVWKKTYTAATGFYRGRHTAEITQAFVNALNANATIGERIAHPENRNEQLAGSVWFYYGSRYGEYLDAEHNPAAEEFLESSLEAAPGNPHAYAALADYLAQAGRPEQALTDYRLSLELNANQPSVLNRTANVSWKMGRHADAVAAWQAAVALLAKQMNAQHLPASFWGDVAQVLQSCSANGQYASISQPVDAMIRAYVKRNGTYQSEPLLKAGYKADGESADWLLKIVAGVPQERSILNMLRYDGWIKEDQKSSILARVVELDRAAARQDPATAGDQLAADEAAWAQTLLDEGKTDQARAVLAQVPQSQRSRKVWLGPEIRLAMADKTLPQLVGQWKRARSKAPDAETLRSIATNLHQQAKNIVMAYVYERALEARDFSAPNFLGLAAIRLDSHDTAGAMQLLHRMLLVSGDVYGDMDSAAALLEEHHQASQAIGFLQPLSQVTPWNATYKVRLAKAMLEVKPQSAKALAMLQVVAGDPAAQYSERAAAAKALKGSGHASELGANSELNLLAQAGCPAPQQASQAKFVQARVAAAACAKSAAVRETLLRAALAVAPDDNSIRLLYIWAAFGAKDDTHALLAAEPIFESMPGYSGYSQYGYSAPWIDNGYDGGNYGAGNTSTSWLKPREAGRLYLLAVHALERRHDFDRALSLLRQGTDLSQGATQHSTLEAERKRLKAIISLERKNAARAPSIHHQIEQNHVVRPRVAAGNVTLQEVQP